MTLTKNHYRGVNTLLLNLKARQRGYEQPYWATFKQWRMVGGNVRKGERGALAVFYKPVPIGDPEGEERTIPAINYFTLFNADQVEGIQIPETVKPTKAERDAQVEQFLRDTGAIIHEAGSRACCSPSRDQIWVPRLEAFKTAEMYYSALLHELSHWTEHPSRLDRKNGMKNRFGGRAYAMEELVAELASAFLSIHLQVSHEPRKDHAQYLNHWLEVLGGDPQAFSSAASKAQGVADYLLYLRQPEEQAAYTIARLKWRVLSWKKPDLRWGLEWLIGLEGLSGEFPASAKAKGR